MDNLKICRHFHRACDYDPKLYALTTLYPSKVTGVGKTRFPSYTGSDFCMVVVYVYFSCCSTFLSICCL